MKSQKAFTLLELVLTIAVIGIVTAVVVIAINPGRQLAQARNAQRSSDLRALHSAVNQYYIDNKSWPVTTMPTTLTEICNTGTGTTTHSVDCTGLVDLSNLVPTYVPAIPTDPQVTASLPFVNTVYAQSATGTGYEIAVDQSNQTVMLTAPNSLEYDLTPVQLGTTTLSSGGTPVDACGVSGDATDPDCWSTQVGEYNYAWSTEFVETGVNGYSDGKFNTAELVNIPGDNYPAAEYCYDLNEGGVPVGTWYLPSGDELMVGWENLGSVGFPSSSYWSSTECGPDIGYMACALFTSYQLYYNGKEYQNSVRCLR